MKDDFLHLSLNDIEVVSNTRSEFSENALKELAHSIKTNGVIQPIVVRRSKTSDSRYELIAGERRYRASLLANKADIPARVVDVPDEKVLQLQIVENLQRKNISTMDEVTSIVRLRDEAAMTHQEISKAIGKSASHVDAQISISKGVAELHDALSKNQISRTVALLIAALDSPEKQIQAVAALKRDNPAYIVKKGDAESWFKRMMGAQPKNPFHAAKNRSQAQNKAASRFESDWKYYLVRFSPEQFSLWQSIVKNRTETDVLASAVGKVMEVESGHVAVS